MGNNNSPLAGITVLDLTRVLSGPYCTMLLADMGARVIKIEQPGKGDDTRAWGPPFLDGESAYFLSINRNKESVTLDFKRPEGRAVLDRLVAIADVLVENFRPGTLEKCGFGYEQLSTRFPRLIYCSVSGFGHTGPQRDRPGYDAVIQAEGGLMSITGDADGPPYRLGVAIADIVSGMFAAQGISLALLHRERTSGRGQHVDVGMLDSVAALLTYQASIYFATGASPTRMGNRHPTIVPYEVFPTKDGDFVIGVGNDDLWRRFCHVIGRDDLGADPRFATNERRVSAYDTLIPTLHDVLRTRTRQEWIDLLSVAGVPCGSVREVRDVLNDPQLAAREMVREVWHPTAGAVKVLGVPVKLSDSPGRVRAAPPKLGQHTEQVLTRDLGFSPQEVARLREKKVI
ncbi:MAG: CoA transferase [Acidobacteria bacterium]|nr:CoA transferase [Acidobacteriota bacterium]